MKGVLLISTMACAMLSSCAKPKEEPEVAYRHCMFENAQKIGRPTYKQASAFSRNCDGYAIEDAKRRARAELGARFDPKNVETIDRIREKHELIVHAYVCAVSSDRPIPPCTYNM